MDDFDTALVGSAFTLAAELGWRAVSVAEAARRANLPLEQARTRFPVKGAILARFGVLADQAALKSSLAEGSVRERLFDLLMSRFDVLQQHRAGVLALLDALPFDPGAAVLLAGATGRSMGWMLEAAGCSASGLTGLLRVDGLTAVWLWTVRAWRQDESLDLSTTMAALDRALDRVEQVAGWLSRGGGASDDAEASASFNAPEMSTEEAAELGIVETIVPPPPPSPPPPASPP